MANPRLVRYPALSTDSPTCRITPDDVYDYESDLRSAVTRLAEDSEVKADDRIESYGIFKELVRKKLGHI